MAGTSRSIHSSTVVFLPLRRTDRHRLFRPDLPNDARRHRIQSHHRTTDRRAEARNSGPSAPSHPHTAGLQEYVTETRATRSPRGIRRDSNARPNPTDTAAILSTTRKRAPRQAGPTRQIPPRAHLISTQNRRPPHCHRACARPPAHRKLAFHPRQRHASLASLRFRRRLTPNPPIHHHGHATPSQRARRRPRSGSGSASPPAVSTPPSLASPRLASGRPK